MEGNTFNHCLIPELVLSKYVYYQGQAESHSRSQDNNPNVEDVEYEEVSRYCRYLDIECITRQQIRTPMEVQQELEERSREDAPMFATYLRRLIGLRYINFHKDSTSKIFDNLRADLPMMKHYSLKNFYAYFKDEPLDTIG